MSIELSGQFIPKRRPFWSTGVAWSESMPQQRNLVTKRNVITAQSLSWNRRHDCYDTQSKGLQFRIKFVDNFIDHPL